jgi:hypothetical protein
VEGAVSTFVLRGSDDHIISLCIPNHSDTDRRAYTRTAIDLVTIAIAIVVVVIIIVVSSKMRADDPPSPCCDGNGCSNGSCTTKLLASSITRCASAYTTTTTTQPPGQPGVSRPERRHALPNVPARQASAQIDGDC